MKKHGKRAVMSAVILVMALSAGAAKELPFDKRGE